MRKADIALALAVAAGAAGGLLAGGAARAEPATAVFDFQSPGSHQEGDYAASAGAEVAGGSGRLALSDPSWFDEGWIYRIGVDLTAEAAISAARFDLSLGAAGGFMFDNADVSGLDLRLADGTGALAAPWWLERFSRIEREGVMRIGRADIPAGASRWYLYFGGTAEPGDFEGVYSYPGGAGFLLVGDEISAAAAGLSIISFADGNGVSAPGFSGVLSRGEVATVAAGSASGAMDAVTAEKPVYAVFDGASGDAAAPLRLAGTSFVLPTPRYSDSFIIMSPEADAHVTIADSSGVLDTFTVSAAAASRRDVDVAGETALITSDTPVVAGHTASSAGVYYDTVILPPPATDITGACAGTCLVSAVADGTEGVAYLSDGTTETFTLSALQRYTIAATGSQGSGPAVRIIADGPVMAVSYGDGDGGDMVAFLPTAFLGGETMIPVDAQYVLAAAIHPGTSCNLEFGGSPHELEADTIAPPYPKRFFWGSTTNGANVPAPASLTCDGPVWAVAERTSGDDEVNLWPDVFFRGTEPDIRVAYDDQAQTKYPRGVEWITTPRLVPADGVARWQEFAASGATVVPEGTRMTFQVSTDGGTRWLVPERASGWRDAAGYTDSSPADEIDAGMGLLDAEAGEMMVRVLLSSPEGTETPSIDEIRVEYDAVGPVSTFRFIGLPSMWPEALPFSLTLRALDAAGNLVRTFEGPADLATDSTEVTIAPSVSTVFAGGDSTFPAAFTGSGTVRIIATFGDQATGRSDPVAVTPASEAGVRMVKAGGDNQFGPAGILLPEPVAVRILDASGAGIAGVAVLFSVTEGGGSLSATAATTDGEGMAEVRWILGPDPGPNRLTASAGGIAGSPAEFTARGDPEGGQASSGGDCGCLLVQ